MSSSHRNPILILTFALLTCVIGAKAGGVYKWTDENGKTYFADKPPPGAEAETVQTDTNRTDPETAERLKGYEEAAKKNLQAREAAKATKLEEEAEAKSVAAHCQNARDQLTHLLNSTRMQHVNDKGERAFVTEDERQGRIQKARDQIKEHCT